MDDRFQDILDGMPEKPPRSSLEPYRELIKELRRRGRSIEAFDRLAASLFDSAAYRQLADPRMRLLGYLDLRVAMLEGEIAQLELSFQNPTTGTDWESTHRRYADLKVMLEQLYEDLARHWELMGQ